MPFRRYIVIEGRRWTVEDAHDPPRPVNHDGRDEFALVFTDEESAEERMGYLRRSHLAQASEEELLTAFEGSE